MTETYFELVRTELLEECKLIDQMLRGLHGDVYLLDIDINNKNHDTKENHEERIRSFESTIRVGCLRDKGADHLGDPL